MEPGSHTEGVDPASRRRARPIGLGLVLVVLGAMLILGAAAKAPCSSGDWTDGRQYRLLCYTDIVPLLGTEQLAGGRLPFLEPCVTVPATNCDEYPVLTMYMMRMAGWVSDTDYRTFFAANAALLWLCAGAIAVSLYAVVGGRALMFALSPTLLVYGLVNWDLLAVALATAAVPALLVRRDVLAGVLLGLGASAKFYPAMLVVPFIAQRLQDREPDRAIRLGWAAAGTWLAVNLPFFIASPSSWLTFFRFNSERCPDFDSLWSIGWRAWNALHSRPGGSCPAISRVNTASAVAFVAAFALAWFLKARRWPSFPRWTLIFPLVVAFLLTNKVYSPQYGLWLVPLFALALPDLTAFVAFSIADVAVFVTRFWWFGHSPPLDVPLPTPVASILRAVGMHDPNIDQRAFELAVVIRAAVLIWCVIAWIRREPEVLPLAVPVPPTPVAALEAPA
jgi:uncharacterized membrane protein